MRSSQIIVGEVRQGPRPCAVGLNEYRLRSNLYRVPFGQRAVAWFQRESSPARYLHAVAPPNPPWQPGRLLFGITAILLPVLGIYFGVASQKNLFPFNLWYELSITLDTPEEGSNIDDKATFTGTVEGLQEGQAVWVFARHERDASGQARDSHIFASSGPCDTRGGEWKCSRIGIGSPGPEGAGQYTVWATVLNENQAFNVVETLRHIDGDQGTTSEPPSLDDAVSDPRTVVRE